MILTRIVNRNSHPLPHALYIHVLLTTTHFVSSECQIGFMGILLILLIDPRLSLTLCGVRVPENHVVFLVRSRCVSFGSFDIQGAFNWTHHA
jgi:hypothetical protein